MSDEIEKAGRTPEIVPAAGAAGAAGSATGAGVLQSTGAGSTPVAGPLSPADLARVAEIKAQVDVTDAQGGLSYGLPAQSRIANFADSLLGDVRNRDAGAGRP